MNPLIKKLSDADLMARYKGLELLRQFMLAHTPSLMATNDNTELRYDDF